MSREEFNSRIEAARDDAAALRQIADELHQLSESWAGLLRLKAIELQLRLRRPDSALDYPPVTAGAPPPRPLWFNHYGLPVPDGRPLYRYRLPSSQFEKLQEDLAAQTVALKFGGRPDQAAQFVLWAAEWFRRRYQGGMQRWDDVGRPIGLRCEWARWRSLADTGLRQWRIAELRINGVHHRLAAIARQGGFPVAAIETASGWAATYLEKLVGLLLAESEPTLEIADRHAASLFGMIPDTWRNDEMRVVSAELAQEIVRLRRMAEAAGAMTGALVSAWLDQHRDGWREELPLIIDSDAGRSLVDGLMRALPLKGGSGSIRASRVLLLQGDIRREHVRLTLNGSIENASGSAVLKDLSENWSRLRLFPSGTCAQHISGELAIAEPDDGSAWTARASTARTDLPLPFATPVEAELRGEGRRVCGPFVLPGGDRIDDGLRVGMSDESEQDTPSEIVLLGKGSGGYRAEPLYLDAPAGWNIEPHGEEARCELRHTDPCGRTIWKVHGAALARSDRDDLYLVRAGQTGERRDTIVLIGETARGCSHVNSAAPIYCGNPRLGIGGGSRPRAPAPGEAWWRPKGLSRWRPLGATIESGLVEFAWRDSSSGHIRDRVDAVILPADFSIIRNLAGNWLTITIHGWPGDVSFNLGQQVDSRSWRFAVAGSNHSACEALLRGDGIADIRLNIPLPHRAWIAHWTGGPVPCDETLPLSTINRFVARTEGRCELMADLLDSNRKLIEQGKASWWVEDELPLSAIRDDITALLRPLGDIDAQVKLNFNDSHENYWYVTEFGLSLKAEGHGLVADRAILDENMRVTGRALAEPAKERDFGSYGLVDNLNHRPIPLPAPRGDWLIYLRQGQEILSRPYALYGSPLTHLPQSQLARAMANRNPADRDRALDALCEAIFVDPANAESRATLRSIIDLTLSLNGLRPATFDIFRRLASKPFLGTLLLFNAAAVEVASIMAIAEGLPFAWSTIPKTHWDEAANVQGQDLIQRFPDDVAMVAGAISDRKREIVAIDSSLAPLVDLPAPKLSLDEASQTFLNRSADRIPDDSVSPFRPRLNARLRNWPVSNHFHRALDAPVAAALAARQEVILDRPEIYCVKDIARRHPRYFREGFAAAFREI